MSSPRRQRLQKSGQQDDDTPISPLSSVPVPGSSQKQALQEAGDAEFTIDDDGGDASAPPMPPRIEVPELHLPTIGIQFADSSPPSYESPSPRTKRVWGDGKGSAPRTATVVSPRDVHWESARRSPVVRHSVDGGLSSKLPSPPFGKTGGITLETDPTLDAALRFLKSHTRTGGLGTDWERFHVAGSPSTSATIHDDSVIDETFPVKLPQIVASPRRQRSKSPQRDAVHYIANDTVPGNMDVFNCSLDWFVHVKASGPQRRVTEHEFGEAGSPRKLFILPSVHPTHPDASQSGRSVELRLQPVCLRSHHSWRDIDGFLAVHYIDGHALDGYDVASGRFLDGNHAMWIDGIGWLQCLLENSPLSASPDSSSGEAFGVRCHFGKAAKRPFGNTAPPSPRSRVLRRSFV